MSMPLDHLTEEALRIVTQDRNGQYGEPEDSFAAIADLWTGYLTARKCILCDGCITPDDVARMMELLKMARRMTANAPGRDSFVDAIGYVLCEARMQDGD